MNMNLVKPAKSSCHVNSNNLLPLPTPGPSLPSKRTTTHTLHFTHIAMNLPPTITIELTHIIIPYSNSLIIIISIYLLATYSLTTMLIFINP